MRKIYIISFTILLLLSLASCGKPKTALLADEFRSQMEAVGCEVVDALDNFSEDDAYESVLVALNEDGGYQIEFYVTSDENKAIQMFNTVKNNFAAEKGNASTDSSVSISNYSKYTLNTNGQYYVVSRIGNTFLYVVTASENKDVVNGSLEALGY